MTLKRDFFSLSLCTSILGSNHISSVPDNDSTVDTTGAEFPHSISTTLIHPNGADGVLMRGVKLSVVLGLALQVHLFEHLQRGLFLGNTRTSLQLDCATDLPPGFVAFEAERLAIIACSDYLGLAVPDERGEGEKLGGDVDHGVRGLFGS